MSDTQGPTIDIGILEILSSKICHDLISPVGAVANGVEFLEEMGPEAGEEVTNLIKFSAIQASSKLQAYRMAYGMGGADTSIKPEDVHKSFEQLVGQEKKVSQEWDPYAPIGPEERPAGFCKLLMCSMLLCMECLPKGGSIKIEAENGSDVSITAEGENANIFPKSAQALAGQVARDDIEPRIVHAYMCDLLSKRYNFTLSLEEENTNSVRFTLKYHGE